MQFAVFIVSPPNYPHSQAFQEVAETLYFALQHLGHDAVLTDQLDLIHHQYIVLGSNLLPYHPVLLPHNAILYNLEQIFPGSPWLAPELLDYFRQYKVWDYSRENIVQLETLGITNIDYVPIGYVPELTRIPAVEEDIDVLFIGSMSPRRLKILEALHEYGIHVEVPYGVYGRERDQLIARAKIVINIHQFPAHVLEVVRISYLLANRRCVVSEKGCDPQEDADFAPGMILCEYDELVPYCLDLLLLEEERQQLAERGFQLIQTRLQTQYLEAIGLGLNQIVP